MTWLYKRQTLQGIRDTLQGLRKYKVCKQSFVWLPWQLFDNMVLFANNCQNDYEKQVRELSFLAHGGGGKEAGGNGGIE